MQYNLYIIYSIKLDRYYIGHTEDLEKRIIQHNTGMSAYTSKANDWVLKYVERYETREKARSREMEIKKKKSRKYIEWLISNTNN